MITLEKNTPVSLTKKKERFANFDINLNWNEGSSGFLKSLFGKKEAIDLDLGCFVEFQDGSSEVLQPLGNRFGSLARKPYVQHSGDDRSGSDESGESLVINGEKWDSIKRVLVYTYIYEGTPAWSKTDAVVTIAVPDHETVRVNMGEQSSTKSCCALVMLTNENGNISLSKEIEFFKSQQPMDEYYDFGFRWSPGRK